MTYAASLLELIETLTKSGYPQELAVETAKKLDQAMNPKEGK